MRRGTLGRYQITLNERDYKILLKRFHKDSWVLGNKLYFNEVNCICDYHCRKYELCNSRCPAYKATRVYQGCFEILDKYKLKLTPHKHEYPAFLESLEKFRNDLLAMEKI